MISFVLATRNDGYGGQLNGAENFTMRRLQITVDSILRLSCPSEVIIVEWNPPPDRPGIPQFLAGRPVRIITVSSELQGRLDADNQGRSLPFYEYVAKDIGVGRARFEQVIACNPDNIFPRVGFEAVMNGIVDGILVRADRMEIAAEHGARPIEELLDCADAGGLEIIGRYSGAGGDFCGFTRATYARLGGFLPVHGNRGVDAEFQYRARKSGVPVIQEYAHYHIHHENAVREAPGRALSVGASQPIAADLARSWDQFAFEVET